MSTTESESRSIGIIGEQPEALLLSILFAEARVLSTLAGPFEPLSNRRVSGSPLEQARHLLALHIAQGRIKMVNGFESLDYSTIKTLVLTSHVHDSQSIAAQERTIRTVSKHISKGTNIIITGLCRPGYTSTVSSLVEKMGDLKSGVDIGVFYLPLLWDGEGLQAFRETPRILASLDQERMASVQEIFLKVFPSLSTVTNIRTAEAAGLLGPVFREVSSALELELATICAGEGVDYSDALNLTHRTSLGSSQPSSRLFARRGSVASEVIASLGRGTSNPSLVRTARRVNGDLDRRIVTMVKGALARCGVRLRHSRIAVLGLDGLGANASLQPGSFGLLQALNRRGAVVTVYPGSELNWRDENVLGGRVAVEHSMSRAVERAQCAVVALGGREVGQLDPHTLAAGMSHPAALCDLTGVLEASNVEKAGLFYASIGRGSSEV